MWTSRLLLTVATILMSSFQYGWHIGVVNNAKDGVVEPCDDEWGCIAMSNTAWGFIVGAFSLGGFLGSLLAGYVPLGRKPAIAFTNLWLIPAAMSMVRNQ